jgi:hypothetical protein
MFTPQPSQPANGNLPAMKFSARDLFAQLESDYGPNGENMNFGSVLMPVFRAAGTQIPAGTELSAEEFMQILQSTSNFKFVEKAMHDRPAAVQELVDLVKKFGGC